jgi:hypothetical protein
VSVLRGKYPLRRSHEHQDWDPGLRGSDIRIDYQRAPGDAVLGPVGAPSGGLTRMPVLLP